jgi:predicted Holliday junction resolvase-like endonuclease
MVYKCLPVVIILLIISMGILSVFTIMKINQIQRLRDEIKKKDDDILQMQKESNATRRLNELADRKIHSLTSSQLEYKIEITILNNKVAVLEKEKSKIFFI